MVKIGWSHPSLTATSSTARKNIQIPSLTELQSSKQHFVFADGDKRAHLILICEAGTLVPYRGYLAKHGWSLCFNDAQDLLCLARLGKDGTIKQIAGPQEESQE